MANVFISYSRKNIEFTKKLTKDLQENQLELWVDWEGIPPTVDWMREIEKGIEEADTFVAIVTQEWIASKPCRDELDIAIKNNKRLIPVVPFDLNWNDVPKELSHINYIFFRESDDFAAAFEKLTTAIHTDYEWVQEHRWLQVRALDWERDNKDHGALLRGKDLQDAEFQLATNSSKQPLPTDLQREYVFASRKATDQQRRITIGISIAGVIALAALAVWGWGQAGLATLNANESKRNEATAQAASTLAVSNAVTAQAASTLAVSNEQEAKKQAQLSRAGELATLGLSEQDDHFDLALLLGLKGFDTFSNARTQSTLFTLTNSHPRLESFLWGHSALVNSVAYSPDGKLLASGSDDNSIILWGLHTSDTPTQLAKLSAHKAGVMSIAFSPDGKMLASASQDRTIILWNISDPSAPSMLATLSGHDNVVTSVAFSPNGEQLASGSWDASIILWDISDSEKPIQINTLYGHYNAVTSVAFSPDGNHLASGSWDDSVIVWDVSDPRTAQPLVTLWGNSRGITSVAFSPDGNYLASGSLDHSILLWDLNNTEVPLATLSEHSGAITSLAFNRDGNRLASGSEDKSIIVWDVSDYSKATPILTLSGHSNVVTSVAFDRTGNQLASGSWDASIILWDVDNSDNKTPLQLASITDQDVETYKIAFSQDGTRIALGGRDRKQDRSVILLWDTSGPKAITQPTQLLGKGITSSSLAFSPDGNQLISGGWNTSTILWDVSDIKNPLPLATVTGPGDTGALAFSPDGKKIAEATGGGENNHAVLLWDISDPRNPIQFAKLPKQHTAAITDLAFSPDSEQLASSSRDNSIILWDISDPKSPSSLATLTGSGFAVQSIAFSPRDHMLAAGNNDGSINLWDISKPSSPSLATTLSGHRATVYSMAFNADGKLLASGSADRSLLLWDLSDISHPFILAPLTEHNAEIKTVAFDGDGKRLASVGADSLIKLWDTDIESWKKIACVRAGRNFSNVEWEQYFAGDKYREVCSGVPVPIDTLSSPSIDMRTQTGFTVNDVELNDSGSTITVAPGTPIHITYNLQVYSDPCPGCITQLVTGFGQPGTTGDEIKCAYDGGPGPFPGNAGTEDITITAPTTPGTYPIIVEHQWEYTCEDARNKYGSGDFAMSHQMIGQVIVSVP